MSTWCRGLVLAVLAGCQFDGSGLPADGELLGVDARGGVDGPVADAPAPDAAIDAEPEELPDCWDEDEYVAYPDHISRYRLGSERVSWGAAREACDDDDAHLVVIDDPVENGLVRSLTDSRVWIGLHDLDDESIFVWVTGAPLGYDNWATGEPNNFWGEDCVEMREDGLWNDEACSATRAYVCECDPTWLPDDDDD